MNKNIPRYSFVILLAITAAVMAYRLNHKAFINNLEMYFTLQGKYPEKIKFSNGFKKQAENQIEQAVESGVHLFLTSSFKRWLNQPHLFMGKLQDVVCWSTSIDDKIEIKGNLYHFYITCGASKNCHVELVMRYLDSVCYMESITGLDSLLIEANRVFASRPVYNTKGITFPPLQYEDAFNYYDTAAVQLGILSGEYDTSIHQSAYFPVIPKQLALPAIIYKNAVEHIHATRNYLYRLIPVAHHLSQLSDSLEYENYDTLLQRLLHLEYGGSCNEHALIVKRVLQEKFTTTVFVLSKDSNQLIDHVINLVYYRVNGVEYAVTVDALTGIIGPVKNNGEHYSLKELNNMDPVIHYPPDRKTKRYTIDTLLTFSNLFSHRAQTFYSDNGFIYFEGFDDLLILNPKELVKDKMPREEFDRLYARVLAAVLLKNVPEHIKDY